MFSMQFRGMPIGAVNSFPSPFPPPPNLGHRPGMPPLRNGDIPPHDWANGTPMRNVNVLPHGSPQAGWHPASMSPSSMSQPQSLPRMRPSEPPGWDGHQPPFQREPSREDFRVTGPSFSPGPGGPGEEAAARGTASSSSRHTVKHPPPAPPSEEDQPPKKKGRQAFSCNECSKRKQKCNRQTPCQHCTSRKVEHLCIPTAEARRRAEIGERAPLQQQQPERPSPSAGTARTTPKTKVGDPSDLAPALFGGGRVTSSPARTPTLVTRVTDIEKLLNAILPRVSGIDPSALSEWQEGECYSRTRRSGAAHCPPGALFFFFFFFFLKVC
jgi:hypothetical protein